MNPACLDNENTHSNKQLLRKLSFFASTGSRMVTFRYLEQVLFCVENDINLVIILQTLQNVSINLTFPIFSANNYSYMFCLPRYIMLMP